MKIDILIAEIGSTTTVVNAFLLNPPQFIGQGQAPTSVVEGDVCIGLRGAIFSLQKSLNTDKIEYGEMFATSSAAGGLKMTVHGLIYDMTVKAAREAALGAGGIIKHATAGRLRRTDIEVIKNAAPNLILIAGGVDYGERDTAVHNAELIAKSQLNVPVIYAGNCENAQEMELIFGEYNQKIYIAENVYPRVDVLNIEPTRNIIHKVFEEHIIKAAGMEHIRDMVSGSIIPTPGAVMECAQLLSQEIGDLIVFDVGGATTDIHSVTDGSEEIGTMLVHPEPRAKRTVEGDLGVFVNAKNVLDMIGAERLSAQLGFDALSVLSGYYAIPKNENEYSLVTELARAAVCTALQRHVGQLRHIYSPSGRKTIAEGKDLTQVRHLVATGGALTRLPRRESLMQSLCDINKSGMMLFPKTGQTDVLYDTHYIMASLGVLCKKYPDAAMILLKKSLKII